MYPYNLIGKVTKLERKLLRNKAVTGLEIVYHFRQREFNTSNLRWNEAIRYMVVITVHVGDLKLEVNIKLLSINGICNDRLAWSVNNGEAAEMRFYWSLKEIIRAVDGFIAETS